MARSELYEKGAAMRRKLMGDAAVEAASKGIYSDPVMQKFIDVATETVFGALWTRPGLDTKTRALICVISDTCTGREPELGLHIRFALAPGLDRGGADRIAAAPLGLYRRADDPRGAAGREQGVQGVSGGDEGRTGIVLNASNRRGVSRYDRVRSDQRDPLDDALCDQKAVERVSVQWREPADRDHVLAGYIEFHEPAIEQLAAHGARI